jgi:hypothetical protein
VSSLSLFFKRILPLFFLLGFWLLGLLFLYPLWRFSLVFPRALVLLFLAISITILIFLFFKGIKGRSVRFLIRQFLKILKGIAGLFCLLVALVGLSYGLWWQGALASLLSLACFYVKIPLRDVR